MQTNTSVISIAGAVLGYQSIDSIFIFTVTVSSLDGRSARRTVSVTPLSSGTVKLSITSSSTKFNAGSSLAIIGSVSATYPVTAVWSVLDSLGNNVSVTALTPTTSYFSQSDTSSQITFPFSLPAGVLIGGRVYSFRLTAHATGGSAEQSFTQVTLTANPPPTGGYVSSSPQSGSALVTQFVISSPGWTADAANFPLSFSFAYRLSAASPYLTLAAPSLRAFTTSTLPAGLISQSNLLTLQGHAADIYGAFGAATGTVAVQLNTSTNVSHVMRSGLLNAFSSGNVNLAIQTVNNVSLLSSFNDKQIRIENFLSNINNGYLIVFFPR